MTRPHIARDVVVDYERSVIEIEGVPLPFFVHPEIEVAPADSDYPINVVRLGILAENVTLRTVSPMPGDEVYDDHGKRSDWVRATVANIAEERLADTLAWLRGSGHDL